MTYFTARLGAVFAAALAATPCCQAADTPADSARGAFFANLSQLCGATFEGASTYSANPNDDFAGKLLVARVAACSANEIRVPFVVGSDRSRTWIFTRSGGALTLQHDHRHADGTPDAQTMYGGAATDTGSALVQSFAADAYTARLIPAAATNVWTLTLGADGKTLTYYLERDGKPRFKAELRRSGDAK